MMTRTYGKTKVQGSDLALWAKHDHAANWSDGGRIREILNSIAVELEAIVADETKAAVADYASNAEVALKVSPEGHLLVGVRTYNQDAAIISYVAFPQLVLNAINEIKPTLGTNEDAQALLSSLISTGRALANLGQPPREKVEDKPKQRIQNVVVDDTPKHGTRSMIGAGGIPTRPVRKVGL
jgi:hypothetical protein